MGAWGTGPFDNDDASDFVLDLAEAPESEMEDRLGSALALPDGYVEAPDASVALAAAALVAVGADMQPPDNPSVESLVSGRTLPASTELRRAARTALRRIVVAGDNELWELWQEAGLTDEAAAICNELERAL